MNGDEFLRKKGRFAIRNKNNIFVLFDAIKSENKFTNRTMFVNRINAILIFMAEMTVEMTMVEVENMESL